MKVMAFNGSPRKKWNTATLLRKALEGAASQGAETELIHLYDLEYQGCISCFACKRINGKKYGRCATKDDLKSILNRIPEADALLLGSPVYFGSATGMMRAFMERLFFPYLVYDANYSTLFPKNIPTGFIYTFGSTEDRIREAGVDRLPRLTEATMKNLFGSSESLLVTDTLQFEDYSKYVSSRFDPKEKARRHRDVFPLDCRKAYELGARLARGVDAQEKPLA